MYNNIKKNKILGINLIKEVQNSYSENYRTLLKEMIEDLKEWKNILCSQIRGLKMSRCQYSPHWSTDLTPFLSKSQLPLLHKFTN